MSRLARQPIAVPQGVTATFTGGELRVKGPKGEVVKQFLPVVGVTVADGAIALVPADSSDDARRLVGTYASHVRNMLKGVTAGIERKLLIEGVGYKMAVAGTKAVLNFGWSHPLELPIPEGVKMAVDKGTVTITGHDLEVVSQFAALLRSKKPPEPYKGKGIRYEGEVVRRKAGKKVAAAA